MEFKVGDLVWIASAFNNKEFHEPPALVVAAYTDLPKIFLCNEEANRKWLEDEDVEVGRVYDIMYDGQLEIAVSEEWLAEFRWDKEKRGGD